MSWKTREQPSSGNNVKERVMRYERSQSAFEESMPSKSHERKTAIKDKIQLFEKRSQEAATTTRQYLSEKELAEDDRQCESNQESTTDSNPNANNDADIDSRLSGVPIAIATDKPVSLNSILLNVDKNNNNANSTDNEVLEYESVKSSEMDLNAIRPLQHYPSWSETDPYVEKHDKMGRKHRAQVIYENHRPSYTTQTEVLLPPPVPSLPYHILQKKNDLPVSLDEDSTIVVQTSDASNYQPDNPDLHSDITRKSLWKGRQYLKQLSTEELLTNLRIIEELRKSYIEEIDEAAQSLERKPSSLGKGTDEDCFGTEHDIAIYRKADATSSSDNEFGVSELCEDDDNYIVEAYNSAGNELVISQLHFDHQESHDNCFVDNKQEDGIDDNDGGASCAFENKVYMSIQDLQNKGKRVSKNSEISFEESHSDLRDSRYSSDSSQSSVYMSLKDCLNGAPLMNDSLYYERDRPTDVTERKTQNEKSRNLKIQIDVTLDNDGDDDDDEEITHRRQTFYDRNSNHRIEKLSLVCDDNRKKSRPVEKKDYLIAEIISTEEKYVSDLEIIVKHYMPYMHKIDLPEHLHGKQHVLFGNISEIYSESKKFHESLKTCGYDHEKIAHTFIKFKNLFRLYPLYSKNKPRADRYLPEFKSIARGKQDELGERLDLGSYLLTPIQRLGKYILFLKGINEELNKTYGHSNIVQAALDMVKQSMSRANDYIAIDSIKRCPLDLSKVGGSFVMREKFNVLRPNRFESMVFFFDEVIVFTIENYKDKETFTYIDSIKMTDLSIVTSEKEPLIIHLKDYSKCKRAPGSEIHHTFTLEAKSPKLKQFWTENIEKRLWEQLNKWKEQVKAQYGGREIAQGAHSGKGQKIERARTLPERPANRRRKTKSSTFYIKLT